MMQRATIEVVISGAVESGGTMRLAADATVASALRAVGGLAHRQGALPHGELVLRRRGPSSRRVEVHRWHIYSDPADAWRSFPLEHRDVLIFSWSLAGDRG